ncbi:outer membrane lipoprotein-sorting protein [Desulfogranum mediterraneum]|uniref:outer membrane lipoprotein-sorting protein n=1 Tax=Desulfogranum mediterraneum TaxID=160661 RepID=UPI0003FBA94B|nr:outer membrane lipoprotein-sorting protein [Desulfogranum mediterraneum]
MKRSLMLLLLLALMPVSPLQALAETPEEQGHAIAVEADRRSSGFGDCTADTVMILRNREGQENRRQLRSRVLEQEDDGDKSLTLFDSPGDVRGTILLTFSHKRGDDDQWLFLPALKRVKRISAANKSGAFMGSEFAFEDLGSRELEKYGHRYLGSESLDGRECFVLEQIPLDSKNSGYSRIISWLDTTTYRLIREEYFDQKQRLLKTLFCREYQQYLGFLWKAHRLEMVNHQNGKETDLLFANYRFQVGLTDRDFRKNRLKNLRTGGGR